MSDINFILVGLFIYVAGGFMEEAVFRGLVLRTLMPLGLVRAAVLSSMIFAVVHLLNLAAGANLAGTILQVIVAFLIWLLFQQKRDVIYLSKSISGTILNHIRGE